MFIGGSRTFNEARFSGRHIYSPTVKAKPVHKVVTQPVQRVVAKPAQKIAAKPVRSAAQSTTDQQTKARAWILAASFAIMLFK